MRIKYSGSSTSTVLLVLVLFYVLLIVIIILFFQQIILNISSTNPFAYSIALIVLIILPILLLIIIILNVIKLLKERARRKSGARFKIRLILFFSFVALLSAIPQTTLSISFLNSAINSQFISQINDVLKSAWHIAIQYYQGKVNNLKSFSESPLVPDMLEDIMSDPEKIWDTIRSANPEIQSVQVFNSMGEEIIFKGDAYARITNFQSLADKKGTLPKEEKGDISIFRHLVIHSLGNQTYYVIFGVLLPKGFEEEAKKLTDSREIFAQLDIFKDRLQVAIILFYFFFSFPILLLSILVSFFLSEEIIRPISNLEEATRRVAQGDFSIRILTRSSDELANLVESFNTMVAELEISKKKILKAEKISAWQEIAQRLAHEIKNPLTPIKLAAQRILKKYKDVSSTKPATFSKIIRSSVSAIIFEVENLNKLLKEFSDFAKLPELKPELVYIKTLIEEAAALYNNISPKVIFDYEHVNADLSLKADRNQLKQVFANLFMNAIQAMPNGGSIFIRTDLVKKEKNNYCRIQIRDTGTGIGDEIKQSIFDPYFTTKKGGAGLGLSIVERIVFDHNGNIWFETQGDTGTTFFIDLPVENR